MNNTTTNKLKMDPAFRKRGFMAVAAVLVSFILAAVMTTDSTNILTTTLPDLRGWSQTMITLPATVGGWCSLAVTILAGTLVKRIGSYNCMKIAFFVLGASILCAGLFSAYPIYFAALLIARCAQALNFFAALTLITDWFLEYRGRMLGIVTMGPPISSAVFIPVLSFVVTNQSFSAGWIGMGVIGIIFAIVLFFLGKSTPEDYGWQPDGFNRSVEELANRGMDDDSPNIWTLDRVMKKKEFYIETISGALGGMIFGACIMLFIPVVTSAGIASGKALLLYSVGSALAIPFSFISGVIDDKFGTKKTYCMVYAVTVLEPLCMALLIKTGSIALVPLCAFFVGILAGCLMNMNPSLKQWTFGRKAFVDFNRVSQACENACNTLGALILSIFVDMTGTYFTGFILFAVMSAIVLVLLITVRSHSPEVIGMEKAKLSAGVD